MTTIFKNNTNNHTRQREEQYQLQLFRKQKPASWNTIIINNSAEEFTANIPETIQHQKPSESRLKPFTYEQSQQYLFLKKKKEGVFEQCTLYTLLTTNRFTLTSFTSLQHVFSRFL